MDGTLVHHINVPYRVLLELVQCALHPDRAERFSKEMPPALATHCDLIEWVRYGEMHLEPFPWLMPDVDLSR